MRPLFGADPAQGLDLAIFGMLGLPLAVLEQMHVKLSAAPAREVE